MGPKPDDESTLQAWQSILNSREVFPEPQDLKLSARVLKSIKSVFASFSSCFRDLFCGWAKNYHKLEGEATTERVSPGVQKIFDFCRIAKQHGLDWAWIDTVCIDKTNNVELQEAIVSMFRWYKESKCCFTYLQDVGEGPDLYDLSKSDWFKRGWTLQELLAPRDMVFFNSNWIRIGTKAELIDQLHGVTSVPNEVLEEPECISYYCMAQRMSWASKRITTRGEDIAYCLMGLFDIDMPLIYGEGAKKAFLRLQIEIMQNYEDESLLAWNVDTLDTIAVVDDKVGLSIKSGKTAHSVPAPIITGLLARCVTQFAHSGNITIRADNTPEAPFKMAVRGMETVRGVGLVDKFAVKTVKTEGSSHDPTDSSVVVVPLGCGPANQPSPASLILVKDVISNATNRWCRIKLDPVTERHLIDNWLSEDNTSFTERHIFVRVSWPLTLPKGDGSVAGLVSFEGGGLRVSPSPRRRPPRPPRPPIPRE